MSPHEELQELSASLTRMARAVELLAEVRRVLGAEPRERADAYLAEVQRIINVEHAHQDGRAKRGASDL